MYYAAYYIVYTYHMSVGPLNVSLLSRLKTLYFAIISQQMVES